MKLIISKDFSEITGLRHCKTSDFSGEEFYHDVLNSKFVESINKGEKLELILDGSRDGYGPSFLDESIGNLVYDFSLEFVKEWLTVISEREKMWIDMLYEETFQQWEGRRKNGPEPRITKQHNAWYRRNESGEIKLNVWINYAD